MTMFYTVPEYTLLKQTNRVDVASSCCPLLMLRWNIWRLYTSSLVFCKGTLLSVKLEAFDSLKVC